MRSFIFNQILFSEVWLYEILPTEEEQELIRILYNKTAPKDDEEVSRWEGEEEISWDASEDISWDVSEEPKPAEVEQWCYDERKPFHHQIFPTDAKAYARQQAEKYIEDLDSFLEWIYDDVESYVLERDEVYQRKFDLIN
ncbi:hypothetical protein GVX81_04090 [[Haemophilus] felis]|uniref:Uncharacterized protein n=1 Tax=[Haemophilus] felis TaxID=123822 RepID=A0A1T0B9S0_9PAST|nr:hypothetical protein [[Haemophilus] felis]NBI40408.1 hypothetical protein [[Haemophilus] felis]OOS06511.1 hypothetical protein B0188_01935 [[Haemophilus] felis]